MDQKVEETREGACEEAPGRAGEHGQGVSRRGVYRECVTLYSVEELLVLKLLLTGDLEGLKVAHDFNELDEGEARILTLKDSLILDNEGESNLD
jgi:hypothetical protein